MHFAEPFICEKAAFLAFTHIYVQRNFSMRLYSVNSYLIYSGVEIFEKS